MDRTSLSSTIDFLVRSPLVSGSSSAASSSTPAAAGASIPGFSFRFSVMSTEPS
uniref:Uncharacterized protein n=1 Tax=uncultured marine virus TaxID=186617 RepID=A0A0F7L9A7_9VIRU|nr:hypothetical protein [uncultured marine virus]